ncbi:hemerythrin domain-containing protein [Mycobacterium sp. 852014-50255_SCH5639931]|uniref:hemerythrin domain-containing protein n=1 Tax=Mycobacterium sp. 852014-50255_SCH5639931 TaxID=1834112 RepID=UPI0009EE9620|nr:hemerythrin domain-containing protein [Mycobacterium sp. 852014-50255_SCH5639931]
MTNAWQPSDLVEAFKEDHAVLGRGLHEVSEHLRAGDDRAAKARGERVDREAGAHIAFEEQFFYPALRRMLGDAEVDLLYQEHGEGLSVIKALAKLSEGAELTETDRRTLLQSSELTEAHVAECGELFGVIGRIPLEEQEALYRELLALRKDVPRWTEFAARAKR